MRINARLMTSFADREPRCGHKTENNKKDEEHGECRGHMFIRSVLARQLCGLRSADAVVPSHVYMVMYY
jgi:hypothetical protein